MRWESAALVGSGFGGLPVIPLPEDDTTRSLVRLGRAVSELPNDLSVTWYSASGDVARQLARVAEHVRVTAIVLGRSRDQPRRRMQRSLAGQLSRRTAVPVIAISVKHNCPL
jgi:K+-sensing histidine kinase KdpD